MKTRVVLTSCIAVVFGLASFANAQLRAGSPEEAEYNKIEAEKNSDAKLALLLDFDKKFATVNPRVLATIYLMAMDIYSEKDNKAKIAEYGDKAVGKDPDNISALLRVSRNYATEKTNLPKAVEYAEKAIKLIETMRKEPTPLGQTDDQYKAWLDQNKTSAEQYASYAKALQNSARPQ
jgi:tetratricopeptide (TPR) repeat protein